MNFLPTPVRRLLAPIGLLLVSTAIWTGCGDLYRPVANPIVKPGGDPQKAQQALVVNNNNGGQGSATQIDVTGDSNVGNFLVGAGPVHGTFYLGTLARAFVANKASDTVSFFTPTTQGSTVSTITLPVGSAPTYVEARQTGTAYVANSGRNTVGVIDVALAVLRTEIPVGSSPVALVQLPDLSRIYVANQGAGTVTVIRASDLSIIASAIPVGSSPVWMAAKDDSSTVYVANQGSGTVSVIDVASDSVVGSLSVGASPRMLVYDSHLRRLYVANTGSNTISVFNADTQVPALLATVTVGAAPSAVTALSDGSRFYASNSGCADPVNMASCSGNTVTVVDATSFSVRKTVTVGSAPLWLDSTTDGSKVTVVNRDSDTISDIRTLDDAVVATNASGSPRPVFVVISR